MAKEKSILVLIVFFLIVFLNGALAYTYSGGTGEPNDPYLIATANDMNEIGAHPNDWDKHFQMIADINMAGFTGTSFNIIGNEIDPFTGVYDGNGHSISNFAYDTNGINGIGMWHRLESDALIKDLILISPRVNAGTGIGVGSLVGALAFSKIIDCSVQNCDVSGGSLVGGLVGHNYGGNITSCYAIGSVSAIGSEAGGLVGCCSEGAIVLNCYTKGNVSAQTNAPANGDAGGLVGDSRESLILRCFSNADVHAEIMSGGLVGTNWNSTISNCYATGTVSGTDWIAGGLVGYNHFMGLITDCYATGIISVPNGKAAGGLVGTNQNDSSLVHCYSTGFVSGNENVGGLVGFQYNSSYDKCFWNTDVNPDVNGIGNGSDPNVIGKSTEEMKKESTFTNADWDCVEIWNIGENQTYPFLRKYLSGDINHDDIVNFLDFAILADHWLQSTQ